MLYRLVCGKFADVKVFVKSKTISIEDILENSYVEYRFYGMPSFKSDIASFLKNVKDGKLVKV